MKNSNHSAGAQNPVALARARVIAAESSVETAKQERRATKHRRKQAELAARRAKKELRRAREELKLARSGLATAEMNYSEQLKTAIRAKKQPRPRAVRPVMPKKKAKKKSQRVPVVIPESAPQEPVPVETVAGDFQLSAVPAPVVDGDLAAPSTDQVPEQSGSL